MFDPDFAMGAKTYKLVDDGTAAPLDKDAPVIEATDTSDHNAESGAGQSGPSTSASEDSLRDN